jgi:hypothetical protein
MKGIIASQFHEKCFMPQVCGLIKCRLYTYWKYHFKYMRNWVDGVHPCLRHFQPYLHVA